MSIFDQLNDELLNQEFNIDINNNDSIEYYKHVARIYSKVENSIAVLSDLKSNKSYIYYGHIVNKLGLSDSDTIESIWEEEILAKVHPDDLLMKHKLELQFFHFIKGKSEKEHHDFHILSKIRMLDKDEKYIPIEHRMFYLYFTDGMPLFALCLYNYLYDCPSLDAYEGVVVNSSTGEIIQADFKFDSILSIREIEVLSLIRKGKMSREIADTLSISKHTVDRHRQNILEKLRVGNSMEACRIAELMRLF